ncbi:hypothetical protein [Nocardiopsis rhodophaea]|uniref:Vgb family protein n=1 Tax=Nocardiopsis rhodophaea TaxID=280238 RepID=UPI0031D19266
MRNSQNTRGSLLATSGRRAMTVVATTLGAAALAAVPASAAPSVNTAYTLPGDHVYPESITQDPHTHDLYVTSYGDGSVFRIPAKGTDVEVFLSSGTDGRYHAAGVKADASGRLWVSGGYDGSVTVYDDATGERLARFHIPFSGGGVNDIAFGPDGSAYMTDPTNPAVYRVAPDELDAARGTDTKLAVWRDLTGTPASYAQGSGLNLNGIVFTDGGALLTANTTTGDLFRIDTGSGEVTRINGVSLVDADGLYYEEGTLWAVLNRSNTIVRLSVSDAARQVVQEATFNSADLQVPTSVIRAEGRLLVTRSQYDHGGPFGGSTPDDFTIGEVTAFGSR